MNAGAGLLLAGLALFLAAFAAFRATLGRRAAYILEAIDDARRGNGGRRLRLRPGGDGLERIAEELNVLLGEFQETLLQKRRMEDARRLMVSKISHDLRTPLTSVLGYVEALSTDGDLTAEERAAFLAIVKGKCLFLNGLIDDFFALSLLEQEAAAGAPAGPVDLCAVAQDVLLSFHRELSERSIEPEIRMPDGPVPVRAARTDLERVLMNLVSNTLRHGHGARRIAFSIVECGGSAVCTLSDDGCGIPASGIPALFDNPYAGEGLSASGQPGRGLGLFIVRRLLERMGGSIAAEGGPSGGVEFRFTVPLL